jgi:hypothetical protein
MQKRKILVLFIFFVLGVLACSTGPSINSNQADDAGEAVQNRETDEPVNNDAPGENPPTDNAGDSENPASENDQTEGDGEEEEILPERPEPNPINVTPILEEGNSASTLVFPDRETSLSVTASDGTIFTLTFPTNAVLSPVEVTMTPVVDLEGFPEGAENILAVHLTPDGLILMEPATLSIQPVSAQHEFTAFTTFSGGKDLHLSPSFTKDSSIDIPLMHFSVPGMVAAGEAFIKDIQVSHPRSNTSATYKEKILEYTTSDLSPDDKGVLIAKTFENWLEANNDLLRVATYDSSVIDQAISEHLYLINWLNVMAELDFFDIRDHPELYNKILESYQLLATGILTAIEEASYECVFHKDPDQAIKLLRYYAVIEKLGLWNMDPMGMPKRETLIDDLKECAKFNLAFDSLLVARGEGVFRHMVASDVPVRLDLNNTDDPYTSEKLKLTFEGLIEYKYFSIDGMPASCQTDTGDGVQNLEVDLGLNFYDDPPRFDDTVFVQMYFPEEPWELIDCGGNVMFSYTLWVDIFRVLHRSSMIVGDGPLVFGLRKTEDQSEPFAVFGSELTMKDLQDEVETLENEQEKQEMLKEIEEFGDNIELTTSLKLFHKP